MKKEIKVYNPDNLPTVDYQKLVPFQGDLKDIDEESLNKLVGSIKENGFIVPKFVWIDNNKYYIIDGHQTIKALKQLKVEGYKIPEIPIVQVQADNKKDAAKKLLQINSKYGKINPDTSFFEDFDIVPTYLDKIEIPELDDLEIYEEPAGDTDEDDIPADEDVETVCEIGDIWQLGEHRLVCGDATDEEDVEALMGGAKADMVFTDPPYLMDFNGSVHADGSKSYNSKHGEIKNDNLCKKEKLSFLNTMIENYKKYTIGAYYICFYRLGLNYILNSLIKHGLQYRALIIWDKGNHTLSNSDYMSKYKPIVYGWFDEHKFYGDKSNFDIWEIDRTKKNDLHPTKKPVKVPLKAIKNSSKKDNIVADFFGGSGSTLIACEKTNRKCYMMELDEHYCDVIIKRWEDYTDKKAKKIGGIDD